MGYLTHVICDLLKSTSSFDKIAAALKSATESCPILRRSGGAASVLRSPKAEPRQPHVEYASPDRPVSSGREQVEIPEMVVGAVRPKWVSPKIAGFVVTFRFTPRARFRCNTIRLWQFERWHFRAVVLRLQAAGAINRRYRIALDHARGPAPRRSSVSSTTVKSGLKRLSWAIIAFRNGSVSVGTCPLSAENRLLASK